ncbi:spore coat-associated protein N [Virgibacillus natechei]|uniref:Spore coat-associated protein N n=1 Tax=Virgibacillus natechei TaxID=1216297 RepID=A0ABS4IJU4_9BACI|nr:TasA family protein [Virgibacillus natechei]MBP1971189.1 spore coat-associated protein N [Virgibacillus natechei]UZD11936.1 CalY family protein [Virgibacillus natechei]
MLNIKHKLITSFVAGALGIILISGGTFAYFSDEIETTNNIQSGTLELGISDMEDGVLFEFDNKQPGDKFDYSFDLTNDGSLEIGDVTLFSIITDNEDFGSQITINSLKVNKDEIEADKEMSLDELEKLVIIEEFAVDEEIRVDVEFEFVEDENIDQNKYQGESMELEWKFQAMQTIDE